MPAFAGRTHIGTNRIFVECISDFA
jgi:hypothetical protein